MKVVNDYKAAQKIAAYLIFKDCKEVGRFHFHFGQNVHMTAWVGERFYNVLAADFEACIKQVDFYGISLHGHCERCAWEGGEAPIGSRLANWDGEKYTACYWKMGFDKLKDYGFDVIRAI